MAGYHCQAHFFPEEEIKHIAIPEFFHASEYLSGLLNSNDLLMSYTILKLHFIFPGLGGQCAPMSWGIQCYGEF